MSRAQPEPGISLHVVPVAHATANDFVRRLHRHHKPTVGCIFCVGVATAEIDYAGHYVEGGGEFRKLRGVAICGRPVARMLDDGATIEINRVCTDGTPNACSMLYGAARRTARAMGYKRVITYTLPEEGGASLRAAGFVLDGDVDGRQWTTPSRLRDRVPENIIGDKWRWIA